MNLEKCCKEGKIRVSDFTELMGMRPRRTHMLEAGDYVVSTSFDNPNFLDLEKISKLDSPEKGDFETVRGTMGPISGNVFIKINNKSCPKYLLIEGDRIGEPGCLTPVYDVLNEYVHNLCSAH